jgi:hypothetical protein
MGDFGRSLAEISDGDPILSGTDDLDVPPLSPEMQAEFDALLDRMQEPGNSAAIDAVFRRPLKDHQRDTDAPPLPLS